MAMEVPGKKLLNLLKKNSTKKLEESLVDYLIAGRSTGVRE